ncbi:hypothetical protein RN001_016393 [Aquatica leii]|uniref:RPA-interacting protein n=1 Tax=Aquatica leii TaxID=1421715 RepID=A0AAN7PN76_9COLE|nr:hypothetical protein RN001_016393 [Aquatica leii]
MASSTVQKPFKPELLRRSPSVQQLRDEIRKQFQQRLRAHRNNEVCRRRELFNNVLANVTDHYGKIQKVLLDNAEDVSFEEMLNIMLEVEKELLNDMPKKEIDEVFADLDYDLTENLSLCGICNVVIKMEDNLPCLICDNCAKLHFSSNF